MFFVQRAFLRKKCILTVLIVAFLHQDTLDLKNKTEVMVTEFSMINEILISRGSDQHDIGDTGY